MTTYFPLPIKSQNSAPHNSLFRKEQFATQYDKHLALVEHYAAINKPEVTRTTDLDILKRNHRFLRDPTETDNFENRVARKYYSKLFKEYCIGDLSRYKTGQIALRWRTKIEVVQGIGQFTCANMKCHSKDNQLNSFEVNFAYLENGTKMNALIKLRLCCPCGVKLNYKKNKDRKEDSKRIINSDSKHIISEERLPQSENAKVARLDILPGDEMEDERSTLVITKRDEGAKIMKAAKILESLEDLEKVGVHWRQPVSLDSEQQSMQEEMDEFLAGLFL